SEEHTSELQSREKLVCRLLHEKKNIDRNVVASGCKLASRVFPLSNSLPIKSRQAVSTTRTADLFFLAVVDVELLDDAFPSLVIAEQLLHALFSGVEGLL